MAQENEELNRRRQRRERMKAHYQKQQRDLIIRLIAVAAVLLVSAVAIVVLSLPKEPVSPAVTTTPAVTEGTSGTEPTDPIPSTTAPGTVPTEETAPSDTTVIRFAAAGDLNITDQVVAAGGGAMDYAPAFVDVLPLLANADLTTLNLEGNLVGVPYGTATKSVPQSMLTALKNAGVDLI